jgi:hypothetical protein
VRAEAGDTIPLYPRRRLIGSPFGGFTSLRRGEGTDIASSRPYEPGDHVSTIDWKGSARLSSARGQDEFIVRQLHAEEMSRVVILADRRSSMALYPADLPWLHKPAAVAAVADVVVASALNQRGLVGYLDFGSHGKTHDAGTPFWKRPQAQLGAWNGDLRDRVQDHLEGGFDAPDDSLDLALAYLATAVRASLPVGTFVFVVSDFTAPLDPATWGGALEHGWDLVPVVVQDPVWEQSFPAIAGVLTPFADASGQGRKLVRLSGREVAERRLANEERLHALLTNFAGLGVDAVLVGSSARADVSRALLTWAESRVELRGRHV